MRRLLLAPFALSFVVITACSTSGSGEPKGDNRARWEWLYEKCEQQMKRRDAGYMGSFERSYCLEAEEMRERITGVLNSNDPGAMDF